MGLLGITLRFLDLVVDLFLDFSSLFFSIRFGGLAFALHELVRVLLSLSEAPFNVPTRLALNLPHPGATTFAQLSSVVGEILGLPRGLHSPVLSLSSTLRGVLRTPHPNFD